ncbi:MAG TPA: metallophosphoesterase, partial [Archangium sp.]|nr:metallophosphoesterase [Archangium sp.]
WGSGVAGHALRVREVCTWSKEDRSHRSLLYQPNPKTSPEGDHTWIVCIPLLCALDGPAVGVISFAGSHQGGMASEQLREYAVHLSRQGDGSKAHELRDNLFSAIHSTFWQFLRSWPELTPQRRRLVGQICKELGLPDVSQSA